MSPSGSFASVDPGRSSSNTVQPLSHTALNQDQDQCFLSIRGPEAAHCLVGDAGIPSKLVGCVYRKLLVSVLPISENSENRLADVDLYDAPVLWATEANSCLDETGR